MKRTKNKIFCQRLMLKLSIHVYIYIYKQKPLLRLVKEVACCFLSIKNQVSCQHKNDKLQPITETRNCWKSEQTLLNRSVPSVGGVEHNTVYMEYS
jgi:hypothetical protein